MKKKFTQWTTDAIEGEVKMKKLLLVGLTAVLLVGCGNYDSGHSVNNSLVDVGNLGEGYDLLRDTNTGCVYIKEFNGHAHPLTPYYGEDGKVVGCGQTELDKSKYN